MASLKLNCSALAAVTPLGQIAQGENFFPPPVHFTVVFQVTFVDDLRNWKDIGFKFLKRVVK